MKIQTLAPQKRFFKVSEKEKPPLLYLSPFVPNTSGGGPVMRAYNHLLALSEHFAVHLVCSAYPVRMNASEIPLEFQECCASSTLYPWVFDDGAGGHYPPPLNIFRELVSPAHARPDRNAVDRLMDHLPQTDFEMIFCFRRATALLALPLMEKNLISFRYAVTDLDDIESVAMDRARRVQRAELGFETDVIGRIRAARVRAEENSICRRFDRVAVCSEVDRTLLMNRAGTENVAVIPNVISGIEKLGFDFEPGHILLVGAMTYGANQDAAKWFCNDILPSLQGDGESSFRLSIVGRDPPQTIVDLGLNDLVDVTGMVDKLNPYYQRAQICVVPIRSGSGTRIKILEAMAYGRPVVSTKIGAEGIKLRPGQDFLQADTPEEFSAAILRLSNDSELWNRLVENGYKLFREKYSIENAKREVIKLFPQ